MEVNNDEFWRALQGAIERAEHARDNDLAEAERLLAGVEPAPAAWSAAQVEAMVGEALAAHEPEGREAPAATPMALVASRTAAPAIVAIPRPERAPRLSIVRRVLAAAMALLMAPSFLAAATVATAVYATSLMLRHTTQTLAFQDAIRIMLNESAPEASRDAAQGTTFGVLMDAIDSVHSVVDGGTDLVPAAREVLERASATLESDRPFVWIHADAVPAEVAAMVESASLDFGERASALAQLADLMDLGISALVAMGQLELPPNLAMDNAVHLQQLRSVLQ